MGDGLIKSLLLILEDEARNKAKNTVFNAEQQDAFLDVADLLHDWSDGNVLGHSDESDDNNATAFDRIRFGSHLCEWVCTRCGEKEIRDESSGKPKPGICPNRPKDLGGDCKPHVWKKHRIIKKY